MKAAGKIICLTKIELRGSWYFFVAWLPAAALWAAALVWLSGDGIMTRDTALDLLKITMYSLFIAGAALANTVFADAHERRGRIIPAQLLPAGAFTQVAAKWLVSFLFWFVFWAAGVYLSLLTIEYLPGLVSGGRPVWAQYGLNYVNMTLKTDVVNLFGVYAIWHSLFFFGGIYFRRFRLLKTTLALLALAAGAMLLLINITGVEKARALEFLQALASIDSGDPLLVDVYFDTDVAAGLLQALGKLSPLIPLFFWWLSAIRLKETER